MRNKDVLFVIGGLGFGGQERALSTLANSLADRGFRITIICLFVTPMAFPLHDSIQVRWPKIDRSRMNKWKYSLEMLIHVRAVIRQSKAALIVSFGDWYNSFTLVASFGLSRDVILANRMGPELQLGPALEAANKVLYRFAKGIVVQTERAKAIIRKRYRCKSIWVVPNAVEMYQVTEIRRRENVVISVGRLSREKGHATLLKAFARLHAPAWRLQLVGEGPELLNLKALARELCISDSVEFVGRQTDVWAYLSRAEVFVLPSFYEGFPNALVEAMSVPLCCVAADCIAGPREIVDDGSNGFLFTPGDERQLAGILERLVADKEQRVRIEGEAIKVRDRFSKDAAVQQFLRVIESFREEGKSGTQCRS